MITQNDFVMPIFDLRDGQTKFMIMNREGPIFKVFKSIERMSRDSPVSFLQTKTFCVSKEGDKYSVLSKLDT